MRWRAQASQENTGLRCCFTWSCLSCLLQWCGKIECSWPPQLQGTICVVCLSSEGQDRLSQHPTLTFCIFFFFFFRHFSGHFHPKIISYSCSPSTLCYKEARPCPIGQNRNLSHFWFTGISTTKIWGQLTNA